ncbi:MAG: RNA methyltransferase [Pseudohongiella sp.]|uniref:RNA methyltransferase n=1 Tax=Pseudohongiella sp. TaxID=1979412 RepID=UPI0034A045B4
MQSYQTVTIALHNPKSPENVGSVMRAAGCYQAGAVRYTGQRFSRAVKYQTDTKNISSKIPLTHVTDLLANLPVDTQVVCVEFAEGATLLPTFIHPPHAIYLFGPEDGSLPQTLIDAADHVVFIPTVGCMNLAASVNVVLYDRLCKSEITADSNDVIKRSRDTNNRLLVKP